MRVLNRPGTPRSESLPKINATTVRELRGLINNNYTKIFINTLQNYFKNPYKIIITNKLLTDVVVYDEQQLKLKYYHDGKTCHKGINKMYKSLTQNHYWSSINNDITSYVNSYEIWQISKYERHPPILKFSITPTSSKPFEHIYVDTFNILNHKFLTIIDTLNMAKHITLKHYTG